MAQTYDEGEPVPDGLFHVDGGGEVGLRFQVPVRVHRTTAVRHVYPERTICSVDDVVSPVDPSPHATVFEGPNTVLYFAPPED